jgi:F-type H+-transporting ATPase subunit a
VVDENGAVDQERQQQLSKIFQLRKTYSLFSVSFIVIAVHIFIPIGNKYKANANRAPSGLQSLLEPIIIFLRDNVAKPKHW